MEEKTLYEIYKKFKLYYKIKNFILKTSTSNLAPVTKAHLDITIYIYDNIKNFNFLHVLNLINKYCNIMQSELITSTIINKMS